MSCVPRGPPHTTLPPQCKPIHVTTDVDAAKPANSAANQPVPEAANPPNGAAAIQTSLPPTYVISSTQSLEIVVIYKIAHSSTYARCVEVAITVHNVAPPLHLAKNLGAVAGESHFGNVCNKPIKGRRAGKTTHWTSYYATI